VAIDDGRAQVHAETRAAWRAWLVEHHARSPGAWLVSWKRHTGRPAVPYADAVEEALCVGWVDSTPRVLDADRSMLRFTPRKARSGWSRPNKERVARLERAGLMLEAGRAAVERARADGSWTLLDAVEDLVVPDDLAAALAAHPPAAQEWECFPRSARRGILEWIVQARTSATRAKRVAETARLAAQGERANRWPPKRDRPPTP